MHPATAAGWADETTAQQIRLGLPPGRVVLLPGEYAVLYQPPPWYTIDVVPFQVAQKAAFTAQYADLARTAHDEGQLVPLGNKLGNAINKCAEATGNTWNELGQGTGVRSLADIFNRAKGFNACKTAYNMIDPSSTSSDRPPVWERWRQKVTGFNAEWNTQMKNDVAALVAKVLGKVSR